MQALNNFKYFWQRQKLQMFYKWVVWTSIYLSLKQRFKHWLFSWKRDEDGDVAFVVFNRLAFVKYKESTLFRWDGHKLEKALKWQGYVPNKEDYQ